MGYEVNAAVMPKNYLNRHNLISKVRTFATILLAIQIIFVKYQKGPPDVPMLVPQQCT